MGVDLFVPTQLCVGQGQTREQRVLVQQEVGDHLTRKQVRLCEFVHLPCPLEQEGELDLQRIPRAVATEALHEGIGFGLLEEELGAKVRGETACQRGLADADRTLDHHVMQGGGHAQPGVLSRNMK
jgi:hypothetical protein